MIKFFFVLCFVSVVSVFAHPHVFVDATVKVIFDKNGLTSVQNHWVYDEEYSAEMMKSGDANKDGKISPSENQWFQEAILNPLIKNNFHNYVLQGSEFLAAKELKNFKATFKNKKLILKFDVVFSIPATHDYTMIVVAVSDPSNYIQITSDMEASQVDAPKTIELEFFNDKLEGLTLFKAIHPDIEGLYLRYKLK